ncbi:helix-turn-helix domain-containing protein [Streptomyces sp. NBC_01728]|uniref:helix-turn-helix domain-containing protein n=1 Tax=unclassified Streptomyces TaxID=2593676 RepID=UPI002259552D|nr:MULTISPECIES: helix-turn-helix domain-containing protein [unclassified Streptomyces]MCX4461634.1 helix-turn-helix domain-containing protein [Streptomyces sp. NBC_01719]MCX4490543.1 helix-turn-helix domain-containing protein [Streptomyces sp. NBC_01728]
MGEGTPYGAAPPSWPVPPRGTTAIAPEPAQLPVALERARVALRLTDRVDGPGPCLVAYDDLGALATLAERLTPQEAGVTTDVLRLEQVLVTHPWVIDTLQAVLDQASLRQAATGLHIHHSTLQDRLCWLSTQLGYGVMKPGGRQRAAVAVLLWRIAHSEDERAEATAESTGTSCSKRGERQRCWRAMHTCSETYALPGLSGQRICVRRILRDVPPWPPFPGTLPPRRAPAWRDRPGVSWSCPIRAW